MFLDARRDQPEFRKYRLLDVDSGEFIPFWVWADDATGEYGVLIPKKNRDGFIFENGFPKVVSKAGNIRFIDSVKRKQVNSESEFQKLSDLQICIIPIFCLFLFG